eukprot:gene6132-14844_t
MLADDVQQTTLFNLLLNDEVDAFLLRYQVPHSTWALFQPFTTGLWGAVIGLILMTATLMHIIGKIENYYQSNDINSAEQSEATLSDAVSAFFYSLYHSVAMLLDGEATYTANLAAIFNRPKIIIEGPQTFNELKQATVCVTTKDLFLDEFVKEQIWQPLPGGAEPLGFMGEMGFGEGGDEISQDKGERIRRQDLGQGGEAESSNEAGVETGEDGSTEAGEDGEMGSSNEAGAETGEDGSTEAGEDGEMGSSNEDGAETGEDGSTEAGENGETGSSNEAGAETGEDGSTEASKDGEAGSSNEAGAETGEDGSTEAGENGEMGSSNEAGAETGEVGSTEAGEDGEAGSSNEAGEDGSTEAGEDGEMGSSNEDGAETGEDGSTEAGENGETGSSNEAGAETGEDGSTEASENGETGSSNEAGAETGEDGSTEASENGETGSSNEAGAETGEDGSTEASEDGEAGSSNEAGAETGEDGSTEAGEDGEAGSSNEAGADTGEDGSTEAGEDGEMGSSNEAGAETGEDGSTEAGENGETGSSNEAEEDGSTEVGEDGEMGSSNEAGAETGEDGSTEAGENGEMGSSNEAGVETGEDSSIELNAQERMQWCHDAVESGLADAWYDTKHSLLAYKGRDCARSENLAVSVSLNMIPTRFGILMRVEDGHVGADITSAMQYIEAMPSFAETQDQFFKTGGGGCLTAADSTSGIAMISTESMFGMFIIYLVFAGSSLLSALWLAFTKSSYYCNREKSSRRKSLANAAFQSNATDGEMLRYLVHAFHHTQTPETRELIRQLSSDRVDDIVSETVGSKRSSINTSAAAAAAMEFDDVQSEFSSLV